jgi:anti-sigma28 factor (negative regulator of flagellin synthesis)
MKINPITNPNVIRSYQAIKPGLEKSKPIDKRDELSLSAEAVSFKKALTEARESIEFRSVEEQTHIANIKSAISQGQYKIDSSLIAARIVDSTGI